MSGSSTSQQGSNYTGTGPGRGGSGNEASWNANIGGGRIGGAQNMPDWTGSLPAIPGMSPMGIFGLPSISFGNMLWASQQAALAQFLFFVTNNIVEHQLAVTKQIADQLCPPLAQSSGSQYAFGGHQQGQGAASEHSNAPKSRVNA